MIPERFRSRDEFVAWSRGVSAGPLSLWITIVLAIYAAVMTTDTLRNRSLENPHDVLVVLASLLSYSAAAIVSRRPWLGFLIFLVSSITLAWLTSSGGALLISFGVTVAMIFICGTALLMTTGTLSLTVWAFVVSILVHEDLSMVQAAAVIGVPVACVGYVIGRFRQAMLVAEARNQELEEQKLLIRARERESLARDLHDIVANQLTSMTLVAGSRAHSQRIGELQEALTEIKGLSREALIELRKLLDVLRTNDSPFGTVTGSRLESHSVEEGLSHVVTRLQEFDFSVELSSNLQEQPPLSVSTVDAVLRILQECSTNALKYARPASTIRITLDRDDEHVDLSFASELPKHVPTRPRNEELSSGQGLIGIRERVQLLGGEASIGRVGGQWLVGVSFPV